MDYMSMVQELNRLARQRDTIKKSLISEKAKDALLRQVDAQEAELEKKLVDGGTPGSTNGAPKGGPKG